MPSKLDVLLLFTRDELVAAVDRFKLAPPDRRAKRGLVDTVALSKKANRDARPSQVLSNVLRSRIALAVSPTTGHFMLG